ncbi:hypothetical protein F383_05455 [Gossypium arboreum]|uniref:Uncharacterized protein n=1 Tax=Gossypium arboreum TaxID=29729 RepID=A0A0B0P0T3_GOSAR|nr:hypothetical protein F383_05455 [Gossypium arboreum]
MFLKFHLLCS